MYLMEKWYISLCKYTDEQNIIANKSQLNHTIHRIINTK